MDIGSQQRVIIVEVDEMSIKEIPTEEQSGVEPLEPAELEVELETAAAWPLPLDIVVEPVS